MLLGIGRRRQRVDSSRDSVHNYYEHMVIEQILRANERANDDSDFLADIACVALNHLPPKYVRHDVDMTFFLTPDEQEEMLDRVAKAVNNAVNYVLSREQEKKNWLKNEQAADAQNDQ
ncbi:late competence development ComFB family protein [Teredinibacter sp. KSP-S5-2]|uniref:late competence development ComFB family protein n=1 Tax=Teredinibacter sp. KSP-S5-2 TaxID=3034506 RepID=UPI002934C7AD|nr:late competence development ComFB family protein [Teredinibacter sp. KSP-S5-2]WNO11589.1 late competence development ComFB family protein [Teredinibacter sp. KSP-S5-2]